MRESEFQTRITDACDWLGLKWHHETDSRRSKAGFPDLVIAGSGGVLFVELKTDTGRTTDDQVQWLNRLREAGAEVHLWRPADWPEIHKRLQRLAKDKR